MAKNTHRSSARFGKPDATGRSSGKHAGRRGRIGKPPKGESWIWLTKELLESPAWCGISVNARRLLDYLLIEHMNHAGTENGNLKAPYDQLVAYGLSRRKIRAAVTELAVLGLIDFVRGGRWAGTNQPSRYRLTFYPDVEGNPPTDEWRRVTETVVAAWREERPSVDTSLPRRPEKQKAGSPCGTTVVPLRALPNRKS